MAGNDGRPMRADARRNYEQLLEQARLAFAESGVDASLDEIARRAGVASGTLYRHFPTRLELIEAVLAGQIAELIELGRGLLAGDAEPFDALATWLRATVRHGLTYRGLAAAVLNAELDRGAGPMAGWHAQLFEAGAALLARARQARVIDAGAVDDDVLRMAGAIAGAAQGAGDAAGGSDAAGARADRLLALLLNGLRLRCGELA